MLTPLAMAAMATTKRAVKWGLQDRIRYSNNMSVDRKTKMMLDELKKVFEVDEFEFGPNYPPTSKRRPPGMRIDSPTTKRRKLNLENQNMNQDISPKKTANPTTTTRATSLKSESIAGPLVKG
jgi:hypothetical protein